jgi:hypothetical protein
MSSWFRACRPFLIAFRSRVLTILARLEFNVKLVQRYDIYDTFIARESELLIMNIELRFQS